MKSLASGEATCSPSPHSSPCATALLASVSTMLPQETSRLPALARQQALAGIAQIPHRRQGGLSSRMHKSLGWREVRATGAAQPCTQSEEGTGCSGDASHSPRRDASSRERCRPYRGKRAGAGELWLRWKRRRSLGFICGALSAGLRRCAFACARCYAYECMHAHFCIYVCMYVYNTSKQTCTTTCHCFHIYVCVCIYIYIYMYV
jgi:hypothetical protein